MQTPNIGYPAENGSTAPTRWLCHVIIPKKVGDPGLLEACRVPEDLTRWPPRVIFDYVYGAAGLHCFGVHNAWDVLKKMTSRYYGPGGAMTSQQRAAWHAAHPQGSGHGLEQNDGDDEEPSDPSSHDEYYPGADDSVMATVLAIDKDGDGWAIYQAFAADSPLWVRTLPEGPLSAAFCNFAQGWRRRNEEMQREEAEMQRRTAGSVEQWRTALV